MKKDPAARGPVRQFISYYRPHKGLFALDMSCALMMAAIDLSFPIISRYEIGRASCRERV